MANVRIPQLTPTIGLDGFEQVEIAVPMGTTPETYESRRTTTGAIGAGASDVGNYPAVLAEPYGFIPSGRVLVGVAGETDVTDGGAGGNISVGLLPTAVTPGAYTAANITVDANGRITAAANGTVGTVTTVSVATANGFSGSVADPTTTPAITLSVTFTGIATAGGGALSAASTTGTGDVVLATGPTLIGPNLGIPSFITLTNGTGLPISTGVSGLGAGVATFLGTPSSANLAAAVTDETGTGALVFATSPALAGTPTGPTAAFGTATTQLATTAFVAAAATAPFVTSRTALAALDVTLYTQAYLSDATLPGRSGQFILRLVSGLSTPEAAGRTADAQQGVYVNSTNNALYTWQRVRDGVHEMMFGATPAASGSAQTTAVQAMFDYCSASGDKGWIVAWHGINGALTLTGPVSIEFAGVNTPGSSGPGFLFKQFNGNLLSLAGERVLLTNMGLRGNGASFTGAGLVVGDGADHMLINPVIQDFAGACIDFPTGGEGTRFRCVGGNMRCTTGTNPAITGPATESTTTGYRHFWGVHSEGTQLVKFNNGHLFYFEQCAASTVDFSATTTAQVKLVSNRFAGNMDIYGNAHIIAENTITGVVTLTSGAQSIHFVDNLVDGSFVDSSGLATNWISGIATATPTLTWKGDVSDPAIGNGTTVYRMTRQDRKMTLTCRITMGSTTTYGSGAWYVDLPLGTIVADGYSTAPCVIWDNSTTTRLSGYCEVANAARRIYFFVGAAAAAPAAVTATAPITFAQDDFIQFDITITLKDP